MSSNSDFPLTGANFFGNWCETLFYGIYLVTCILASQILFLTGRGRNVQWLPRNKIRWLLVSFAAAFFIFLTTSMTLGTYHNYVAFILSKGPDDAIKELQKHSNWVYITRTIPVYLTLLLGDYILVYRCWIIYAKRWLIIMPSITIWLGVIASSIRTFQLTISPGTVSSSEITKWVIALWTLSTAQNVISTGLLICRIWKVERELQGYVGRHHTSHLQKVLVVIAESGALYTTSVLLSLVLLAIKNNGLYPMTNITIQLAGIVYNVILVRCSRIRDQQFASFGNSEQSTLDWHPADGPVTVISTNSVVEYSEAREAHHLTTNISSESDVPSSVKRKQEV